MERKLCLDRLNNIQGHQKELRVEGSLSFICIEEDEDSEFRVQSSFQLYVWERWIQVKVRKLRRLVIKFKRE